LKASRSLRGRLLLAGLLGIALVTVVAVGLLGEAFRRASERAFDRSLENEHAALVGLIEARPDGSIGLRETPIDARYRRAFSGFYWQVGEGPAALYSRSLWDFELILPDAAAAGEAEMLDAAGPSGQALRVVRQLIRVPRANAPVLVMVASDLAPVMQELSDFRWLAGIAIGLLSAMFGAVLTVQVHVGLRPLSTLAAALARIRSGHQAQLDINDMPGEVQPLAGHLNELLAHHERAMQRARRTAADLAHSLKTPLAALDAAAQRPGADLPVSVRSQVARMQAVVQRQLASGGAADFRARSAIAPAARALANMLGSVHRDRRVAIHVEVDEALRFPGAGEDLEELLGNLLDNACKWARSHVQVGATETPEGLSLWVDDDGPGIDSEAAEQALQRGVRLDEQVPGSGLGLAIVQDLLEAHGGSLALQRSPLGGLRARATLPAAI
jgi:signal transduction histidine kinase